MSSPSQRQRRPSIGQSLNSSNSTSALFTGSVQRSWMSQTSGSNAQASASNGLSPKAANPRGTKLPPSSKIPSQQSESEPLRIQTIPTGFRNADETSVSGPFSPISNNAPGAAKRLRTISGNGLSGSTFPKRPRLESSEESGECAIEEATAALPSPPSDRTPLEGEFRASAGGVSFVPISRATDQAATDYLQSRTSGGALNTKIPPPPIKSDVAPTLLSAPTQTKSPPLEGIVTTASGAIAGVTASGRPASSSTENMSLQVTSMAEPASVTSSGHPLNEFHSEHVSGNSGSATLSPFFQKLHEKATARLELMSQQPGVSSLELARLRLLQQACSSEDEFFLVLHHLYCSRLRIAEQTNKSTSIKDGILVLQRLLAPNDQFSLGSIQWFCEFAVLLSNPDQERLRNRVWQFLGAFAILWSQLLSVYQPYKLPPSSSALMIIIPGLTSTVLQQVIFRASVRTSWVGPHDACIEQCESVFLEDQRLVRGFLRGRPPDDPSIDSTLSRYDERAAQKFMKILTGHQAHSIGPHNPGNESKRSQKAAISSADRPDLRMMPQHQKSNPKVMAANRRSRLSFPNLNIQAVGNSDPGQSSKEAAASSPGLAGPFSAPLIDGNRSFHRFPSSSPSTPAIASNSNTSLPNSVTQSPQSNASYFRSANAPGISRTQHSQLPLSTKVLPSSNVASFPNIPQGPTMPSNGATLPKPLDGQDSRMPLPPQLHPIQPIAQETQPQPLLTAQQHIHRRTFEHPQYASHMGQAAPMRRDSVTQQNQYLHGHNFAGTAPTVASPFTQCQPQATTSSRGNFQPIPAPRNIPSTFLPAYGQHLIPQTARTLPQQNNMNFRTPVYRPAAQSSGAPSATVTSGSMGPAQTFGQQPHLISTGQPTGNAAVSLSPVPNLAVATVNQAYPINPRLDFWDPASPREHVKSFRYIKHVFFHKALTLNMTRVHWKEEIDKNVIRKLPKDILGISGELFRQVSIGTYLARIRCIKLKKSDPLPSISQWAMSDMSWPHLINISINGVLVEIRRQPPGAKDSAFDATRLLKAGQNEFSASVLALPADCSDQWLVGLEFVEVVDAAYIKEMLTFQTQLSCRNRIIEKLRSKDLEVEVVKPQIVLDMTDPFSSRIFKTPVRGKDCVHNQCFDLDTFLQTRGAESTLEPCLPEEFRCPICKGDVRPQVMVVDGFFAFIRSELEKRGRLDVKAVILHESGEWEIKEEVQKEDSDESAKSDRGIKVEAHLEGSAPEKAGRKGKEKATIEVVVLDDD